MRIEARRRRLDGNLQRLGGSRACEQREGRRGDAAAQGATQPGTLFHDTKHDNPS